MDLIKSQYLSSSEEDEDNVLSTREGNETNGLEVVDVENENNVQDEMLSHTSESFRQIQVKEEPLSELESCVSDSESLDSSEISDQDDDKVKQRKRAPPKAKDELWLEDLPPIEDLHISVPHEQCQPIGVVKSVVNTLVIVEAYPLTPALDIDSVLFLDSGDQALGHIFDVFGPVKHPHYCVRFNSKEHIDSRGVRIGVTVYCAPKTPHTSYVLVAQLQQLKGTDSSWRDDHETPVEQLEFSDDESEKNSKNRSNTAAGFAGQGRKNIRSRKSFRPRPNFQNPIGKQVSSQFVPQNVPGFALPRHGQYGQFQYQHQYFPPAFQTGYSYSHGYFPPPPPPPPLATYVNPPCYYNNPPPPPPSLPPASKYY